MVLWGITYEAPSYLPLAPFSARSPFSSLCLFLAHTTTLSHRLSPSQFPSSLCSFLPTPSPHVHPLSLFPSSQSLFAHVCIHHLFSPHCLLLPIHITDLLTPLSPFQCLTPSAALISKRFSYCSYTGSRTI